MGVQASGKPGADGVYPDLMARLRAARTLLACAGAWLCLGGFALAQEPVPDDNGSVDQYAESLPSADGKRAIAKGSHPGEGAGLPASVRRRLPNSANGQLLERVASQPALGAPSRGPRGSKAAGVGTTPGAGSAIGDALFGSWVVVLLILMALMALAALAAALARRRRSE
jgi:hypothetical protein